MIDLDGFIAPFTIYREWVSGLSRSDLGPYIPYHLGEAGECESYGFQRHDFIHFSVSFCLCLVEVK